MAAWVLIPCLKQLFAEFNEIAPGRSKASDGSIGDTAHQAETSDHNADEVGSVPIHDADKTNEVHAIDVDNVLHESDLTMEKVVQFLLARCRSGSERRLRYVIYNRRIWSASSSWKQQAYTGASAHTEHAHFSASYTTSLEASTASWHLGEIPVALTAADKTWIKDTVDAVVKSIATSRVDDWLDLKVGDKAYPNRTVRAVLTDVAKLRGVLAGDVADTANAALSVSAPLSRMIAAADQVLAAVEEDAEETKA